MQRMIGMEIDVTQEHQTKDELTRLYSLLSDETATIRRDRERIFEMTDDLMAVGTADGTLLSVNPAWSTVMGFRSYARLVGTECVRSCSSRWSPYLKHHHLINYR